MAASGNSSVGSSVAGRTMPRLEAREGGSRPRQIPGPMLALNAMPSLLRNSTTWRVLLWWTVVYGIASWIVEYLFSLLDASSRIAFSFAFNRVVYAIVWSGAIVVAIVATERFPVTSTKQIGRIAVHAAVCLAVTVLWGVVAYYGCVLLVPGWQPFGVARMLAATAKNVLFGYGLVVVLVHITLRVRAHRTQEITLLQQAHEAAQAQLQILKLELQPHFLFNALHSVSALIQSDPGAANDTLVLVSDMLRHAVDTARVQEVALHEELSALRLYTAIQEVRFGDRLRLTWRIDDDTVDAEVPHMLLQPLVENAIKHGVEVQSNAGKIVIAARRDGDGLVLSIRDDGPGYGTPSSRKGSGLGIANVRSRLTQLYGGDHAFTVATPADGGTLVTITIPFAVVPANEQRERARVDFDDRERSEYQSAIVDVAKGESHPS